MKRRIVILLTVFICIFLILGTAGCWNRRELDTLAILMGMGIDKPSEGEGVKLTAQIVKAAELKTPKSGGGSSGGGGGGAEKAYWNIESSGETVFEALRGFTHESSRKVYLPHNQVIIFGRDTARDGVQKYIDFFVRDPETRLNVWVLVADGEAGDIFDVESEMEKMPALDIADLIEAQAATSQTSTVKLREFLARLLSKTTAPIAPVISIATKGQDKNIYLSGTAVFKTDKMVYQLGETESRGLLWTLGKVKSGIVVVDCPEHDGGKVSLEIIRADAKMTPEIREGRISFKIEVKEEGNLGDQSCTGNLAVPAMMSILEKEENEAIRAEIMAALKKAREYNTDIFGFGEIVHQKYPAQWKELESRWDEVFPGIDVEVVVKAKVNLTGQLARSTNPE